MIRISVSVEEPEDITLEVSEDAPVAISVSGVVEVPVADTYAGPYEFTPGDLQQIIHIQGLMAVSDITINPIPNNYGKISWNGSTLTVS